ncbi:MAG: DNA polymerase III subunit beta [Chloroflexales bacterium]
MTAIPSTTPATTPATKRRTAKAKPESQAPVPTPQAQAQPKVTPQAQPKAQAPKWFEDMVVTVPHAALKAGIAKAVLVVTGKPALPIIGHLLLTAADGRLTIQATNLETTVVVWMPATVAVAGAATVPAELFASVVGSMPTEPVTLALNAPRRTLAVTGGRFTSMIKGFEAEEFPTIPTATATVAVTLPASLLRAGVAQVAPSAAPDDSRPVLAGVRVRLRASTLVLAASDGFRLAHHTITLPEPIGQASEYIVPAGAMSVLAKVLAGVEGDVQIIPLTGGNSMVIETANIRVVSRLIDGKYPDVEAIIPKAYRTRAVLEVAELRRAVKLASFFAASSQQVAKVTLAPDWAGDPNGTLVISANAPEVGDNTGTIPVTIHGEGGEIALNVRYLAEMLDGLGAEQVSMEMQTKNNPAVFRPVGDDRTVHIIMPMALR